MHPTRSVKLPVVADSVVMSVPKANAPVLPVVKLKVLFEETALKIMMSFWPWVALVGIEMVEFCVAAK